MEKSVEEQFQAAVKVIQNLPKDGKFQASDSLKLKFYAFYKQATEGINETRKPAFYDVVNRYKWDAWARLGQMSREAAMRAYVDELKSIIETMGLNSDVSLFYETIGPMYEFVDIEQAEREMKNDQEQVPSFKGDLEALTTNNNCSKISNGHVLNFSNGMIHNGLPKSSPVTSLAVDSDGDEFSDTVDTLNEPATEVPIIRGDQSSTQLSKLKHGGLSYETVFHDVDQEISKTLSDLRINMATLSGRVDSLERRIVRRERGADSAFPLTGLSPSTVAFIVGWPLVVHGVFYLIRQRQLNRNS